MALCGAVVCGQWVIAGDSPWNSLIPFKKQPAIPKSMELTTDNGPWLILAASFKGPKAESQAVALITELRNRHKLAAYMHKQTYDFTQTVQGTKINPKTWDNGRVELAKMQYYQNDKYDAIAVLVGDFRSVNDPVLEKTLEKLKYLKPDCLDITKNKDSNQSFAAVKDLCRKISTDPDRKKRGPMASAFASRNPLLPDDFFTAKGVDDFVLKLNKGVQYSLLDNPRKFTVRVATFRGATSINQREIADLERSDRVSDKLAVAADKAHRLTTALRKKGIEAYEFHDRTESVVTIGSFDSEGTPRQDGTILIDPKIYRIVEEYRGTQTRLPGRGVMGMQPKMEAGIPFDIQPVSMAVPRRSIAADYARRREF
jgi:hypothetical protein